MKSIFILAIFVVLFSSCNNPSGKKVENQEGANDSIQIVKKPFKTDPSKIEYHIPILKGTQLRQGVQKRFYADGGLYSKIPFTRNVRNGIAYTYYKTYGKGKPAVWKEQVYVDGKLNGVCKRYHEDGKLQAEYSYKAGFPAVGLKEFSKSGKEVKHPSLILTKKNVDGYIQIKARMSNNSKKVKMYTGVLIEGKYVSNNKKELDLKNGVGEILIPATTTKKSITVIATMSTKYHNQLRIAKTIAL
jgi:hypothetical protein